MLSQNIHTDTQIVRGIHIDRYGVFREMIESTLHEVAETEKNGKQRSINLVYSILVTKFNSKELSEKRKKLHNGNHGVNLPRCLFGEGNGLFGSHNPYTGTSKDDDEVRRILSELFGVDFSKTRVFNTLPELIAKTEEAVRTNVSKSQKEESAAPDLGDNENLGVQAKDTIVTIEHEEGNPLNRIEGIHSKEEILKNFFEGFENWVRSILDLRIRSEIIKLGINQHDFILGESDKIAFSAKGERKLLGLYTEVIEDILMGYIERFNAKE